MPRSSSEQSESLTLLSSRTIRVYKKDACRKSLAVTKMVVSVSGAKIFVGLKRITLPKKAQVWLTTWNQTPSSNGPKNIA